ncbi:hypothetical protein [Neobacillus drentensis]|uniref:hypothetical protein n=1 Tax=Neobacillus drentensis TaxID=220684 RepID=UPI0030001385
MWQSIWDFIKNDFLGFIGTLSITGLVLTTIIKTSINNQFSKNLEKHKSELMKVNDQYKQKLDVEIEDLKHKQQRVFTDFELYTSKKHEKYPELFKLIEKAFGNIFSLRGQGRFLTFENTNRKDIEWYLEEKNVTDQDKEEILRLWDIEEGRHVAIERIRRVMRVINYNEAYEKWQESNEYFILNDLFLSEEVSRKCRGFLDLLWEYLDMLDPNCYLTPEMTQRQSELRDDILPSQRGELKDLMKNELTVSFSENI